MFLGVTIVSWRDISARYTGSEVYRCSLYRLTMCWDAAFCRDERGEFVVRTLLRRCKYPPDRQQAATEPVLKQAEALSREWVA